MITWLKKNKCYDMRNSNYFKKGIVPTDLMINTYVGNTDKVIIIRLNNKNIVYTQ